MTTATQPLAPTDAELLVLNVGEVYFSESPSKYPEVHGTQYHAGTPGVLAFARAVLAKWGAQPVAPVWTPASTPPKEEDGEVLVRMADGRCEIAWATYWHGSSNAFAQWTFRDPDEDEQPVEWMHIPKHGATAPQPLAREPLTDEQKRQRNPYRESKGAGSIWVNGFDAAERAHGITKGGQHGTE